MAIPHGKALEGESLHWGAIAVGGHRRRRGTDSGSVAPANPTQDVGRRTAPGRMGKQAHQRNGWNVKLYEKRCHPGGQIPSGGIVEKDWFEEADPGDWDDRIDETHLTRTT